MGKRLVPCTVTIEACPLCGSDQHHPAKHPYYHECDACGLIFMTPRPTQEAYHKFYTSGYYRQTRSVGISDCDRDEMRRARRVAKLVPKCASHLDVGCSRGYLLELSARNGTQRILGVEPFRDWVKWGIPSVATIDEVEGEWDCITCIHTLEHTLEMVDVSQRMIKLLSPGGTLIVEVPNLSDMDRGYNQDGHVYYYRPQVIERLFEGLTLVKYWQDPQDIYTFTKTGD